MPRVLLTQFVALSGYFIAMFNLLSQRMTAPGACTMFISQCCACFDLCIFRQGWSMFKGLGVLGVLDPGCVRDMLYKHMASQRTCDPVLKVSNT